MSEENRTDDPQVTPEGERSSELPESSAVPVPASTEAAVSETAVETPVESVVTEDIVAEPEAGPVPGETTSEDVPEKVAAASALSGLAAVIKKKWYISLAAAVAVLIVLAGLLYMLEQQGRVNTGLFDGVNRMVAMNKAVATVNDTKISQFDLEISMSQISAGAAIQGIDIADPEVKSKIQDQAIDMLVNTELLKQEAAARNIVVTDADVDARLESLKTDVGGEEILAERMAEFNIDQKTLLRDIRNELTIQALLDEVFKEKGTEVTNKDIQDFYEAAGGNAAGLPPLADVREQIEQQVRSNKEQEIVTTFVAELKEKAKVDILI